MRGICLRALRAGPSPGASATVAVIISVPRLTAHCWADRRQSVRCYRGGTGRRREAPGEPVTVYLPIDSTMNAQAVRSAVSCRRDVGDTDRDGGSLLSTWS